MDTKQRQRQRGKTRRTGSQTDSASARAVPASGANMVSTRVNHAEKKLIDEAASLRGWSTSKLVRVAVLEKAQHILNTTKPNKFDMLGKARWLAKQLVEPECRVKVYLPGQSEPIAYEDLDEPTCIEDVAVEPSGLRFRDIATLRRALALGGSEFLALVIAECEALTLKERTDLDDPVELDALGRTKEDHDAH